MKRMHRMGHKLFQLSSLNICLPVSPLTQSLPQLHYLLTTNDFSSVSPLTQCMITRSCKSMLVCVAPM